MALNLAYGRAHGDTLQRAIEKEISDSVICRGLAAMIQNRCDYFAFELNWAMAGAGTDKAMLTRIVSEVVDESSRAHPVSNVIQGMVKIAVLAILE